MGMDYHILVPMTHAEESERALEFTFTHFPTAETTVVHVINPIQGYATEDHITYDQLIEDEEEKARELFKKAANIATNYETTIQTEMLAGEVPLVLLEYIDTHDVDQVILGSRGRDGVSRLLLGSVAETIVRRSPVPVTVVQ